MITKLLIDNLGRVVGKTKVKKGEKGNREYGLRSNRGYEVIGIARLANISSVNIESYIIDELTEYIV